MLKWNAAKVKNLTGAEIWFMIIARVLIGFGLGVLATRYFPQVAEMLGIPALVIGGILFLIAAKGLFRTAKEPAV
jgi:NADH:ubiquinone oxidoreductase subunit 6 (subunit J)